MRAASPSSHTSKGLESVKNVPSQRKDVSDGDSNLMLHAALRKCDRCVLLPVERKKGTICAADHVYFNV